MNYPIFLPLTFILASTLLSGCGGSNSDNENNTTETPDSASVSSLVINEIVASAIDDGNDWIELYAIEGPINLSSYTIVDDNTDHTPQNLPSVTLAAGEYIIIQAIDETDTPPADGYYVTFKLGSDDAVTLFNDGVQVDQLDWEEGDAPNGSSFGLFNENTGTEGTGSPQTLTPTPGEANQIGSTVLLDTILDDNAPIRINEIVAKDNAGGYDWIELYVSGTGSVFLGDYTITDENNELFQLPEITLGSGEYYRVYATTDQLENAETVSFKLGSSDQLSLFQGDDLIDQLIWKKGQALINYSYGRFPDGSDNTQILSPTPLTTNQTALHSSLIINEVVAKDINDGNDWFELYNNGNGNISLANYTVIDGSNDIEPVSLPNVVLMPNEYIVIYATDEDPNENYVPFKLGKSDELSLIFNDEVVDYIEWDESDVPAGYSVGFLVSDTTNQDSWKKRFLTPTKGEKNEIASAFDSSIVQDISINITTENWQDILNNPLDEEYHDTSVTFNGVTLDSVAIRTKGNSSLISVAQSTSDRYSFKLDINKYVDGQKFFGLKKFTLHNSFNDPSYMREAITYDLLTEIGVAAPQHAFVNLYVNDELFGLYLMVEAIDGEFLENNFTNANGDLYKPDGVGSDLKWISADIESYSDINLKTNEDTSDNGAFINFVEQLSAGSTDVIDVDSLLKYLSVSVALSNLDSYHGSLAHNYYLYEQDGIFSLLPWDFNEAFGTFNMGCNGVDIRELYIDEPTSGSLADRPLVANVLSNSEYLETYHNYLWTLIEGSLSNDAFNARVNTIADLIRQHVTNDPTSFYGIDAFEQNLDSAVGRFYGLTDFMSYRVNNMTQQLQGSIPSAGNGNGFCSNVGGTPPR